LAPGIKKEYRLRGVESMMLKPRRMFGLKRDKMYSGWRKLHDEEFHILYSPTSRIQ
jgi:hypothetical protein